MGPMAKWVDDHISFRIPHVCLPKYNARRAAWHHEILNHGGHRQNGSRIWYRGKNLLDGSPKEFNEDCTTSLEDLSNTSPHSTEDQLMQMQTSTKFPHNLEFSGNHPNWFPSAWRYLILAFTGTSDMCCPLAQGEKVQIPLGHFGMGNQAHAQPPGHPEVIWQTASHFPGHPCGKGLPHQPGSNVGLLHP
jgi:hypothetical protein